MSLVHRMNYVETSTHGVKMDKSLNNWETSLAVGARARQPPPQNNPFPAVQGFHNHHYFGFDETAHVSSGDARST